MCCRGRSFSPLSSQVFCKGKSTINGDASKCPYARHLFPVASYPRFMGGIADDTLHGARPPACRACSVLCALCSVRSCACAFVCGRVLCVCVCVRGVCMCALCVVCACVVCVSFACVRCVYALCVLVVCLRAYVRVRCVRACVRARDG